MITVFDTRISNGERAIERWNGIFEATVAEPRRQIVVSLLDRSPDRSIPLPESAINPAVPTDLDCLRQQLIHHHLPLLEDLSFIEWSREPFVATRGPRFDEVAVVFESLHRYSTQIPDSLVVGCHRLEAAREMGRDTEMEYNSDSRLG